MCQTLVRPASRSSRRPLVAALGLWLLGACAPALLASAAASTAAQEGAVRAVELEQRPGRFTQARLRLPAGRYVFRVRNRGVDHPVSLRLAPVEDSGAIGEPLPAAAPPAPVGDGAAAEGGVVELRPGRYSYRCALNPTPHYFLTVE